MIQYIKIVFNETNRMFHYQFHNETNNEIISFITNNELISNETKLKLIHKNIETRKQQLIATDQALKSINEKRNEWKLVYRALIIVFQYNLTFRNLFNADQNNRILESDQGLTSEALRVQGLK